MKKLILILILLIAGILYGANRLLSLDGTGGQHALMVPGTNAKPVALMTETSGPLALELAKLLDQKGYRLILQARDKQQLDILAATLNNPQTLVADASKPEDRAKIMELIKNSAPDLVINNTISLTPNTLFKSDLNQIDNTIAINSTALTDFTITAAQAMQSKHRQGIILNITSYHQQDMTPSLHILDNAITSYINHFSRGFDYELKDSNIRILSANPRAIMSKTNETSLSTRNAAQKLYQQIENRTTHYSFPSRRPMLSTIVNWLPRNIKIWLKMH